MMGLLIKLYQAVRVLDRKIHSWIIKIPRLFNWIKPKTDLELRDEYFAASKNLVDLERRMRVWENENLRGWH
tara:strand:+ start:457 stop:672 length:216 start_codon:yes stop_codon:yes gene_type:complete